MAQGPLDGIRVIDFSHSWAAPHCARILADFGAEVIKVEYVRRLCLLRGARKDGQRYNLHPGWLQVNRNKLSITLDLNVEEDREIFTELIKTSDVIVHNARPGVMEKLGFGCDALAGVKKDLIVLSMSAFGSTGPYASYVGYGAVFEALGGIQTLSSYEKEAKPARVKEMDVTNGVAGACAVMTALLYRQKTGKGQFIDFSQLEAATHATIGEHLMEQAMNGRQTLPLGNRHWKHAPQGCYPCKGKDQWVTVTIRSEHEWRSFCRILEHPEWDGDPRFSNAAARHENHDVLDECITSWTLSLDCHEAMQKLQSAGVPAGAVLDAQRIIKDVHLQERRYFVTIRAHGAKKGFPGLPFRLSRGPGSIRRPGPGLGEDNEHVVCELLRRPKGELKAVKEEEVGTAFDPG